MSFAQFFAKRGGKQLYGGGVVIRQAGAQFFAEDLYACFEFERGNAGVNGSGVVVAGKCGEQGLQHGGDAAGALAVKVVFELAVAHGMGGLG